ncbi:hypothetical protein RHSIM_Rhsim04G0210500 [Rhododendron simsii]|uniref:Uncharacterized protein n=1 Tax=Rhododendron simsii TaxID=118357 RepID=A0A834H1L8_RHOSS|nr:hypothetical protein RHSIM_Rhsim04G0210500 [Rhododendron simsii]
MDYQAPDPTIAKLEMPWKSCDDVEIWGSFNGVLLVSIDEELCLWNPSIGMYQKISPPGRSSGTIVYGLGYDSINDDFKCFAKDGEVVLGLQLEKSRSVPFKKKKLEESLKLVIYNPKQKTKRIGMPQDWKLFEVTVYVESLVSPHGCNSTRRHC